MALLARDGDGIVRLGRSRCSHLHADQFADPALLHRHPVEHISFSDRTLVVRNDDELALLHEPLKHADEAIDV